MLIGICLLSIGILGLISLQSRGIRGNDLANRTTQAIGLAQDQLEQLITSASGDNFPLSIPNPNPFPDANNPIDETGTGGGIFTREYEIEDPGPITNSQNIIVRVGWADIVGQHNVTVSGIVTSDSY